MYTAHDNLLVMCMFVRRQGIHTYNDIARLDPTLHTPHSHCIDVDHNVNYRSDRHIAMYSCRAGYNLDSEWQIKKNHSRAPEVFCFFKCDLQYTLIIIYKVILINLSLFGNLRSTFHFNLRLTMSIKVTVISIFIAWTSGGSFVKRLWSI